MGALSARPVSYAEEGKLLLADIAKYDLDTKADAMDTSAVKEEAA